MDAAAHCPECRTEYVAGVTHCSDCGAELAPGPVPESEASGGDDAHEHGYEEPDTLLVTAPGDKTDVLVNALLMDDIPCLLECQGQTSLRLPGQTGRGSLARTLPVNVSVPGSRLADAREILESLDTEDMVGDQWQEGLAEHDHAHDHDHEHEHEHDHEHAGEPHAEHGHATAGDQELPAAEPEGVSTGQIVALLVAAVAVLLFMLR